MSFGGRELTVDLERQAITDPAGTEIAFAFDAAERHRLLHGLDDIALTLERATGIDAYETASPARFDTRRLRA